MTEEDEGLQEAILHQQYRRALSSFEGIILSQIEIKNRLGARLNYSIQAGIIILGAIAVSILVLLLTLSAQINRISAVVADMNAHFSSVATEMHSIRTHMASMEKRAALMQQMDEQTAVMEREMRTMGANMDVMRQSVQGIDNHVAAVRTSVGNMSLNIDLMNNEVQFMGQEMLRMSKPARAVNKMFPFP